ncbi:unnamed protein product [Lupinus luteus]|uniref:Uncharacterized protein n=1 Tax=Lupinus luteus TaxID=3873 RepID=A0AAV1WUS4_LUPLU
MAKLDYKGISVLSGVVGLVGLDDLSVSEAHVGPIVSPVLGLGHIGVDRICIAIEDFAIIGGGFGSAYERLFGSIVGVWSGGVGSAGLIVGGGGLECLGLWGLGIWLGEDGSRHDGFQSALMGIVEAVGAKADGVWQGQGRQLGPGSSAAGRASNTEHKS